MKPIILVVVGLLCSCAFADDNAQAARAAASAWLAEIDHGDYGASWKDAAPFFKAKVPEKKWVDMLSRLRQRLGTVVSRKFKSVRPMENPPRAPAGHYVILQFNTHFANKPASVETVTPMLSDGKWRVSGYFVR